MAGLHTIKIHESVISLRQHILADVHRKKVSQSLRDMSYASSLD
jgi:hypothetical protein